MKKQILSFALVAAMVGSVAVGCSSTKKSDGGDSTTNVTTVKDSTTAVVPDTAKKDTTKKDTVKTPPKM